MLSCISYFFIVSVKLNLTIWVVFVRLYSLFIACRLPIEISFTATEEKEVNFNVVCHVKKKISPLTLNVKAEGYAMNAQLICEDSLGNKVELTSKGTNRINLGMVRLCVREHLYCHSRV